MFSVRISKPVKVFAALCVASALLWMPPAIAAIRGPVSPLPVRHVNYGLYMHGGPPSLVEQASVLTAPQEPLGASLGAFLPRRAFRPMSQPVRLPEQSSGRCGGDLPTCRVMMCENKGKLTGKNRYSSASGKWQFVDGTWGGYGGYAHAQDAPESVQDAKARELWAGGAGRGHWRQCL